MFDVDVMKGSMHACMFLFKERTCSFVDGGRLAMFFLGFVEGDADIIVR